MINNIPQQIKKYKEITLSFRQIATAKCEEKHLIYDYYRNENLSQKE